MSTSLPQSALLLLMSVVPGVMTERPPSSLLFPLMGVAYLGFRWTCLCHLSSALRWCLLPLLLVMQMPVSMWMWMPLNFISMHLSPHCWTLQSNLK
jgi:hypothetical protein